MAYFSEQEYLRYTRQLQLPGLGSAGQRALKSARVLIVGCGGLGAPVSLYLAGAGVGKLTLVDGDAVDLSNLHRQIIFTEADVGQPKALVAANRLRGMNSDIDIDAICEPLHAGNARTLVEQSDLVLDCTDSVAARYLINENCIATTRPWLFASVHQYSGQCALFLPGKACYRCLYPEAPSTAVDCNAAGVLGALPGLLGTLQANEALRYLCGMETSSAGHLLLVESADMQVQRLQLGQRDNCPACSQPDKPGPLPIEIPLAANLAHQADELKPAVLDADTVLIDVRSHEERAAFHMGGEHLPLDELDHDRLESLASSSQGTPPTLLFYCQSGPRSERACAIAAACGYSARSIPGGIAAELQRRARPGDTNTNPDD